MNGKQRVIIENVKPRINCGKFPIKRVVNDNVSVEADIFCDGHDELSAEILYRRASDKNWSTVPLNYEVNDLWTGFFIIVAPENYVYTIRAWIDQFTTWYRDIEKRIEADTDYEVDLLSGAELIDEVLSEGKVMISEDREYLQNARDAFRSDVLSKIEKTESILSGQLVTIMQNYTIRKSVTMYDLELNVVVDRQKAAFSAWYEMFPRSAGKNTSDYGNLNDVIERLPYIAGMGFDVLYLPPVHPIGKTNRKGPNNSVGSAKGDPGSPWAIGSSDGGHKALHPKLGTFSDFKKLVDESRAQNIEIAMDIAFQCSPDHPYVTEHPEWFRKKADGSIQYAENPPKKYEDIFPLDFETDDWQSLWDELKSVFLFWIDKGIRIFRVDNPHTKSINFWGWVIGEIKKDYPDTIFLAEAFTRPKVMYQLAKQGFDQSYTYFTWRNTKEELTRYMEKLVNTEVVEFMRPNLWPNTPDILPEYLQVSGRPGFIIRLALAATLSSNYGIYGPAFELMESQPREPVSEEYLNSEKYEVKDWNIEDKNSLQRIIKQINHIRNDNPALHSNRSLRFHDINNDKIICYSKHTSDFSNVILVVVNLDPNHTQSGWIYFPVDQYDMSENSPYQVHDMLGGAYYLWNGSFNYVELNPGIIPVHIFKIRRKIRTERDFDYFT
ncbi:MAG TPA: alpha-1,4-glucan--maltose-1-phosphate maltosyltransferase [Bacteroidales bacterium]|nr:alpha-1,4-glucan--maltose-1-phosphate maltosyltransferase [Bacteroidales bacterium]